MATSSHIESVDAARDCLTQSIEQFDRARASLGEAIVWLAIARTKWDEAIRHQPDITPEQEAAARAEAERLVEQFHREHGDLIGDALPKDEQG